jgi:hypothetical protein
VHPALWRDPQGDDAHQAREAQLARLQALRLLLWNHAGADPIKAAEALIKLKAREARLLGLEMPTKVAITYPDGGIPPEAIRRVLKWVDAENGWVSARKPAKEFAKANSRTYWGQPVARATQCRDAL